MKKFILTLGLGIVLTGCGSNPKSEQVALCALGTVVTMGVYAPFCISAIKEEDERQAKLEEAKKKEEARLKATTVELK